MFTFFMFFFAIGLNAQTTLINPATDGGFNSGTTFAANGWTVANEGTGAIKWAIGTAASGFTATASTTASSPIITLTAANTSIAVGQAVYGINIPNGATVASVSGTSVTLSVNATATESNVTLGFSATAGSVNVPGRQLTTASIAAPKIIGSNTGEPLVQKVEINTQQIEAAVSKINKQLSSPAGLSFQIDPTSGDSVVTVIDSSNNTVIRQIPSELSLRIAQSIENQQSKGLLVSDKV